MKGMNKRRYYVKCTFRAIPSGLLAEEDETGVGGDMAVGCAILSNEDGSYSYDFFTLDGRTGGQVERHEVWAMWAAMAGALSDDEGLNEAQRTVCAMAYDVVMRGPGALQQMVDDEFERMKEAKWPNRSRSH